MRLINNKAFTLVEVMMVIVIIGLLSSIAIPKFTNFIRKARESATKGNLGSIRGAISIYYNRMEGEFFPANLACLVNNTPKLLERMPLLRTGIKGHEDSIEETGDPLGVDQDSGKWGYIFSEHNVIVACTHTDSRSENISSW